jgi:hypothetical protein
MEGKSNSVVSQRNKKCTSSHYITELSGIINKFIKTTDPWIHGREAGTFFQLYKELPIINFTKEFPAYIQKDLVKHARNVDI